MNKKMPASQLTGICDSAKMVTLFVVTSNVTMLPWKHRFGDFLMTTKELCRNNKRKRDKNAREFCPLYRMPLVQMVIKFDSLQ